MTYKSECIGTLITFIEFVTDGYSIFIDVKKNQFLYLYCCWSHCGLFYLLMQKKTPTSLINDKLTKKLL